MRSSCSQYFWGVVGIIIIIVGIVCLFWDDSLEHIPDSNGPLDYSLVEISEREVIDQTMGSLGDPTTRDVKIDVDGVGPTNSLEYSSEKFTGVYKVHSETIPYGTTIEVNLTNFKVTSGNFAFYVIVDGEIVHDVKINETGNSSLTIPHYIKGGLLEYVIAGESAKFTFTAVGGW